ncbi:MAG: methylmalonyl-CoA mutase, partial [Acidobacteriota bacterium]|nr:methylmalonyl-CoA mutase [Acidobacteriota bacterium]
ARVITALQADTLSNPEREAIGASARRHHAPVIGITGTGGAGKSSLTDELLLRFRLDQGDKLRVAVIAVDPSKRRGGALLGDRIRMNTLDSGQVFFRSLATRASVSEIPAHLPDVVNACRAAGYDLVVVETPGIGQGDAAIVDVADLSLYVMTPEFGAASQLEKIEMLDLADVVAINKFDRHGAHDALRAVERQWRRAHAGATDAPVFGTVAAHFNDAGTTALYQYLRDALVRHGLVLEAPRLAPVATRYSPTIAPIIPDARTRYLADVAQSVRHYHEVTRDEAERLRQHAHVRATRAMLTDPDVASGLDELAAATEAALRPDTRALLDAFDRRRDEELAATSSDAPSSRARLSLSGTAVSRVALPNFHDEGDLYAWLRRENLPGSFPYTAGVFALKRENEDPARMFAGEGDAFRTNRRFHLLSAGQRSTRLSTAFDSVTLYGRDPDTPPDVYGKVGTSGVSIATLDDVKALYEGFDLCDPSTSVSMTINGPAPTILAMFFNAAIDQQVDRFVAREGREPRAEEAAAIRASTLRSVRGTVQADILKEDQGQNTCIFSTEFSLGVMADVQAYFVEHDVKNFYSVSISGYHIAEAGANPLTQLAFTLANGFTYVESYLARGMHVDDFAGNLSFFFSNGMDPEYTVIGRVAR